MRRYGICIHAHDYVEQESQQQQHTAAVNKLQSELAVTQSALQSERTAAAAKAAAAQIAQVCACVYLCMCMYDVRVTCM